MTSAGVCTNTPMVIDEETFAINCYALPLAGFDVVLGVQRLRTLRPILWDFSTFSMEFWCNHKTVKFTVRWHSSAAPSLHTTPNSLHMNGS